MQDIYVLNRQTSYSMLPRLNKHAVNRLAKDRKIQGKRPSFKRRKTAFCPVAEFNEYYIGFQSPSDSTLMCCLSMLPTLVFIELILLQERDILPSDNLRR